MGEQKTILNKIIVFMLVFMMLFSNCGFTIAAIADSEEFSVVKKGLFQKDEFKFLAYFEDEDGNKITEKISDVNDKAKLILEVNPQIMGYLKEGKIKAVAEDGSKLNFRFVSIVDDMDLTLSAKDELQLEEKDVVIEQKAEEKETLADTQKEDVANVIDTKDSLAESVEGSGEITFEGVESTNVKDTVKSMNIEVELDGKEDKIDSIATEEVEEVEEFVDEEKIIEEKLADAIQEDSSNVINFIDNDIVLSSNDEISLSNVINDTKIEVEVEFNKEEKLKVDSLMKDIQLQFSGVFVNDKLEEVKIGKEAKVSIGWSYNKEITVESNYTKFSPFVVGEVMGTIIENKVSLIREVNEENYLPLAESNLEIKVPTLNGKKPIAVDVNATKLMATLGNDIGKVNFSEDNWNYDEEKGIITIKVVNEKNGKATYSNGSDEYVIIYRFEDYVDVTTKLDKNIKASAVEYSAKKNNTLKASIDVAEDVNADIGELITYSIETTEGTINKGKINANYNSDEVIYETEITNQVSIKILTSDLLDQLKVDNSKDYYLDNAGFEFEAGDIRYKTIKFEYSVLKEMLAGSGEIVITNKNEEVIATLNEENLKSEADCTINLNDVDGIKVIVNNIVNNGTLNYELTKAIGKCNYDKSALANFKYIESRVSAEVNYSQLEQTIKLPLIGCKKEFENSKTKANIHMGKDTLSSTKSNGNVQIKIELNNDDETSDLYVNPVFEVVFPKYVTDVKVEGINTIYDSGLKVSDFETYTESDIVKMRVALEGTQKTFNTSEITHGTNIIINATIEVSEFAPAKEDQVKLYYVNEGVTNYESQTKWSLNKTKIPGNVLKQTNGFDVDIIKYQAPKGVLVLNSIKNYDGNLGIVKSVREGKVTAQIPLNDVSKIATMELMVLNNNETTCSNVYFLGRIPFKGNTDSVTGNDLGTNIDTKLIDVIKEDGTNPNLVEIYYSENGKATKDLSVAENGWTKTPSDLAAVKSYLIEVKGDYVAESVLRFTYDFEIPANLPYDSSIQGSFGAFFNVVTDTQTIKDTSVADIVGLVTEAGPKLDVELTSNYKNGDTVGEAKFVDFTVKVKNIGSIDATNIVLSSEKPAYMQLYNYVTNDLGIGDNNYIPVEGDVFMSYDIPYLQAGDTKEIKYRARVGEITDDNTEIKVKVKIQTQDMGLEKESNEITLKVKHSNFDMTICAYAIDDIGAGKKLDYNTSFMNISGQNLRNVVYSFYVPEGMDFVDLDINGVIDYDKDSIKFDEITRNVTFKINEMLKSASANIKVHTDVKYRADEEAKAYYELTTSDGVVEKSSVSKLSVLGAMFEIAQTVNKEVVKEGDQVQFIFNIKNVGSSSALDAMILDQLADSLNGASVQFTGKSSTHKAIDPNTNKLENRLPSLLPNEELVVEIFANAAEIGDGLSEKTISNVLTIKGNDVKETSSNVIEIKILNNDEYVNKFNKIDINDNSTIPTINNSSDSTNNGSNDGSNDVANNNANNSSNGDTTANNGTSNSANNESNSIDSNAINNGSNSSSSNNLSNNTSNNNGSESLNNNKADLSISGKVWIDENENGIYDNAEKLQDSILVKLVKDKKTIESFRTNGKGEYNFEELEPGNYIVMFEYDSKDYKATLYKATGSDETNDSDCVESDNGNAYSNSITLTDKDVANIDLGLVKKDKLDLKISKYLTSSKVVTSKRTEINKYKNKDLTKIEIKSRELDGAKVTLEYTFVVENVGTADAEVTSIVDVLPEGTKIAEEGNNGWSVNNDNYIFNTELTSKVLASGEKAEVKLLLEKEMTADNTGIVLNKGMINGYQSKDNIKDSNDENNTANNQVFIVVSTGYTRNIIIIVSIIIICAIVMWISTKNVRNYKNKIKTSTTKSKKVYR